MTKMINREEQDIAAVKNHSYRQSVFAGLPDSRKTENVSLAACKVYGNNLEFVPEKTKTPEMCRVALKSSRDCSVLEHIPFSDVCLEGIEKFSTHVEPVVLISFVNENAMDEKIAEKAVQMDGDCLAYIPENLLNEKICRTAILNTDSGVRILDYIPDRFFTPSVCETAVKRFKNGIDRLPKDKRTAELFSLAKKEHQGTGKDFSKRKDENNVTRKGIKR